MRWFNCGIRKIGQLTLAAAVSLVGANELSAELNGYHDLINRIERPSSEIHQFLASIPAVLERLYISDNLMRSYDRPSDEHPMGADAPGRAVEFLEKRRKFEARYSLKPLKLHFGKAGFGEQTDLVRIHGAISAWQRQIYNRQGNISSNWSRKISFSDEQSVSDFLDIALEGNSREKSRFDQRGNQMSRSLSLPSLLLSAEDIDRIFKLCSRYSGMWLDENSRDFLNFDEQVKRRSTAVFEEELRALYQEAADLGIYQIPGRFRELLKQGRSLDSNDSASKMKRQFKPYPIGLEDKARHDRYMKVRRESFVLRKQLREYQKQHPDDSDGAMAIKNKISALNEEYTQLHQEAWLGRNREKMEAERFDELQHRREPREPWMHARGKESDDLKLLGLVPVHNLVAFFMPVREALAGADPTLMPDALKSRLSYVDFRGSPDGPPEEPLENDRAEHASVTPDLKSDFADRMVALRKLTQLRQERSRLFALQKFLEPQVSSLREALTRDQRELLDSALAQDPTGASLFEAHKLKRLLRNVPIGWAQRSDEKKGSSTILPLLNSVCLPYVMADLDREINEAEQKARETLKGFKGDPKLMELLLAYDPDPERPVLKSEIRPVIVEALDYEAMSKAMLLTILKDIRSRKEALSAKISGANEHLVKASVWQETTSLIDLIDTWNGARNADEFTVSARPEYLSELGIGAACLFYAMDSVVIDSVRIGYEPKVYEGLGTPDRQDLPRERMVGRIFPDEGAFGASYKSDWDAMPRPFEILTSETCEQLSPVERLWFAFHLSRQTDQQRKIYEKGFNKAMEIREMPLPLLLNYAFALSYSSEAENDDLFGRPSISPNYGRRVPFELSAQGRAREWQSAFYRDGAGRIQVPDVASIQRNPNLELPRLRHLLQDPEKWFPLLRDPDFKAVRDGRGQRITETIERASLADLEPLSAAAEPHLGAWADQLYKRREDFELALFLDDAYRKFAFELDRKLGPGDVEYFTWIYRNVSAAFPNSSKLYIDYINTLNAEDLDAVLNPPDEE